MEAAIGNGWGVFVGVTLVLMGGAGWMTGQALARTWRPMWQVVPYGLLLGMGDRFLVYALFEGELASLAGYALDTAVIGAVTATAYRLTRAARMVDQYPWLYERRGPFGWRERAGDAGSGPGPV